MDQEICELKTNSLCSYIFCTAHSGIEQDGRNNCVNPSGASASSPLYQPGVEVYGL